MNVQLTRILLILSLAGFALLSSIANAGSILWGTSSSGTNPSSVFTIDAATGTATLVGATGLGNKISAIAVDPADGTLYAIRGSACTGARLITIDPTTGAGTIVGILIGPGFDGTNETGGPSLCYGGSDALVFGADGTLYAGGWNGGTAGGKLLVVDKTTGAVTANFATDIIAPNTLPSHIAGMATAGDGKIWVSRGNNTPGTLHIIDPTDGSFSFTLILSDSGAILSDIAFAEDGITLFASNPNTGQLVTIHTGTGVITMIGAFGGGEKISGLTSLVVEVLAEDCESGSGGCNPTGAQTIELPPNAVIPAGATITQNSFRFTDACNGSARTFPIPGKPGQPLKIPWYLCGSPDFVVLVTEAPGVTIPNGTVLIENEPGVFFTNPLSCDSPLDGADPQQQDAVVWQPTDYTEVLELHAIEVTDDCGSSRGRSRKLSYMVVGMHIDFGTIVPEETRNAFLNLTLAKMKFLKQAVEEARFSLKKKDYKKLKKAVDKAIKELDRRKPKPEKALKEVKKFLKAVNKAKYSPTGFNHNGEHIARGSNIRFMLTDKLIPLFAKPKPKR